VGSPKDELDEAIERWRRDAAREQVARWRGDPDALTPERLAARHVELTRPRTRDRFEEALERGLLDGPERGAVEHALRAAHCALARHAGAARVAAVLATPIPYDSDHHRGADLLGRLVTRPDARARRGMARALEATFTELGRARREARERLEEALASAKWLSTPHPDRHAVEPEAVLAATDDAWQELLARVTHAAGVLPEHWSDLLHALRASRWDDLVPPASRPRRLADRMRPLGLTDALAKRARTEPPTESLRARVLVRAPREDVRVAPGRELGLASERDLAAALARAAALLLAHPGLPLTLARPGPASVARTVGALVAHLYADPLFVERELTELTAAQRRALRESALALELFELRTDAVAAAMADATSHREFADEAHAALRRAWRVDLPPSLAAVVADDEGAVTRLRAEALAPALAVALREQYDEDFWRNPRAAEPLHHAAARGAALTAEAWGEELGVDPDALGSRMTELLS